MSLKDKGYLEIVNFLKKELDDRQWDIIVCKISFFDGGGYGDSVRYYLNGEKFVFVTDTFEFIPIVGNVFKEYLYEGKKRDFNEIILNINKEGFSIDYNMDEEKVIKEKQGSELLFPNYLYERMRTLIYEYEIANNLRTPIYDEYGLDGYEESWETGLFTFIVDAINKTIQHTIELSFEGVKRIVPMPLETYFKDAIFYHYEITHGELKEFWKPWNKIVLTAPEQFIPLGKDQEYIEYSLVDIVTI